MLCSKMNPRGNQDRCACSIPRVAHVRPLAGVQHKQAQLAGVEEHLVRDCFRSAILACKATRCSRHTLDLVP